MPDNAFTQSFASRAAGSTLESRGTVARHSDVETKGMASKAFAADFAFPGRRLDFGKSSYLASALIVSALS